VNPDLKNRIQLHLAGFVTERRKRRIEEVLALRTRYITVVAENLYQPHNASAIIRTCDCFGVQDLHVIEHNNRFEINDAVAVGSGKWVTVHRHTDPEGNATIRCLQDLKDRGYRIAALTLQESAEPLKNVSLDQKLALCLGTEEEGLSDTAHEMSDLFVQLPMHGFNQSFNVSVTCALSLYELVQRLHTLELDWHLTEAEKDDLRYDWYHKTVPEADLHVARIMAAERQNPSGG
jgi:tRNA (guanosine-2'-O-)-methyltransferase